MSTRDLDDDVTDTAAPSAARRIIVDEVTEALQAAEELGGPEGNDYAHTMLDIADVLISRINGLSSHFALSPEIYARCRKTGDQFRDLLRQHLSRDPEEEGPGL